MQERFSWGHININTADLDASVSFYKQFGFRMFMTGIPYLDLSIDQPSTVHAEAAAALGLPPGTRGRACIMELNDGFPKLDLTQFVDVGRRATPENKDLGLARLCLASRNLAADYEHLTSLGVPFISAPQSCHQRMAEIAVCKDPDGTLIELIEVHLERWLEI